MRNTDSEDVQLLIQFVRDVLKKLHVLFRNCLDFQSISPHLRSHSLLTDHEWQVISKKDTREQQVDEFLKYLPHKGKNCLNELIECLEMSLEHSGHRDLLTALQKLVQKQTSKQTDDPAPSSAALPWDALVKNDDQDCTQVRYI